MIVSDLTQVAVERSKPLVNYIMRCRACYSKNVVKFLHFPQMPLTDDFVVSKGLDEFLLDIDVFYCGDCTTVQTQHDVQIGEYYNNYQYSVGQSVVAYAFMKKLVDAIFSKWHVKRGASVLEIGSGDGAQLVAFQEAGCSVLGYEPSEALCEASNEKGVSTVHGLFSEESVNCLPAEFKAVDVVMCSYTFDHIPDPRKFLSACRSILKPNGGLLIIEVHDFNKIVNRNEFCLFEHEHSIYLTNVTAKYLLNLEGFDILDFELLPDDCRRANSLLFVATPREVTFFRDTDRGGALNFEYISKNIANSIANLDAYVSRRHREGKRVAGYGAGGRGVMTLAAMHTASLLCYIVDKKPKQFSCLTPKSRVPVVTVDALLNDPVDEILVFSFGYMSEILDDVQKIGYRPNQLVSLLDVLSGNV